MNENNEIVESKEEVVEPLKQMPVEDNALGTQRRSEVEDKVTFYQRPTLRELLKKRELDPKKATELEKGDLLALIIAAVTVFLPVILGAFAVIALLIWLIF